jgi:hypothetical protein
MQFHPFSGPRGPVEREKGIGGVITRRISLKQRMPGRRIAH